MTATAYTLTGDIVLPAFTAESGARHLNVAPAGAFAVRLTVTGQDGHADIVLPAHLAGALVDWLAVWLNGGAA